MKGLLRDGAMQGTMKGVMGSKRALIPGERKEIVWLEGGRQQRKIPSTSQFGPTSSLCRVLIPSSDFQTSLVNLFARVPENSQVIFQF